MTREELIAKYKAKIAELQKRRDTFKGTGRGGACISVTGEIQAYNAVITDLQNSLSLPPADATAEEILAAKQMENEIMLVSVIARKSPAWNAIIQAMHEFAAQRQPQPTAELQILMNDISEWSDKTFGNSQRNPAILHHLSKEVNELIDTFHTSAVDSPKNRSMRMEFADCMMLLLDSAAHAGFAAKDLIDALREKLEINKARKWGKPDANGVVEHIEQPIAEDAEEIQTLKNKVAISKGYPNWETMENFIVDHNNLTVVVAQLLVSAMEEVTTLHAQKIADKMVSERLREDTYMACDVCGCHPSVIITTSFGKFCQQHAKYV